MRRYIATSSVLEKRPVSIGSMHANLGLRARQECLTGLFGPEVLMLRLCAWVPRFSSGGLNSTDGSRSTGWSQLTSVLSLAKSSWKPADSGRSLARVREGSNGSQLDSGHCGHLWSPGAERQHWLRGSSRYRHKPAPLRTRDAPNQGEVKAAVTASD